MNFLAFLNCKIQNLNFPLLHSCFSMDGYTGKKVVTGFGLSRGSSLSFRDVNHEDKSLQSCNRIGCSTRQSSIPRIQSTVPEKPKFLKPPFRFKNSNSSAASSSRPFSSTSNFRKYYHERHNKVSSLKEADVAESSNRQAESGENLNWQSDFHGRIETKHLMDHDRPMLQRLSMTEPSSGSNATSSSRFGKQISRRFGSAIQDTASSFLRRSSALRCVSQVPKTSPPAISSSRQHKYSVNNIGCASISDVLPSDSSSGFNTRGVSVRRKLQDGEGSSKAILAQPEQQPPQETSRQTRIQNGRDIAVSSGIRRGSSVIQNRRMRLSEPEYESIQLVDPLLFPQPSHAPLSAPDDVQESSRRSFSSEMPSTFYDSSFTGRPGTSSRSSQTRLLSGSEDRDDYRRFNIEGIAEILLALERIEQEEELTDEQLLVLEANLFLGGLNYYDQHRDMRLDIDNMSYEELLALEEEMGTVSTALSEEAISKCLKRSIYRSNFTFPRNSHKVDDVKCSICQEEYVIGEEMGSLPCEHRFHVECIRQWLRLKNWCPICKAAAADSFKNKTHS